jgi:hypothetical protein
MPHRRDADVTRPRWQGALVASHTCSGTDSLALARAAGTISGVPGDGQAGRAFPPSGGPGVSPRRKEVLAVKSIRMAALVAVVVAVCSVLLAAKARQGGKPAPGQEVKQAAAAEVTLPDLPGITTPDKTPHACVDCHVNHPERKMDFRLPSILARWRNGADPKIFEKAQAAAPEGRILTGRHPDVSAQISIIPNDCLVCHARDSQAAPPFARLLHAIHLVGGRENHFLAVHKGTCTNCHKLDQKTGAWHTGSGRAQ